MSIPSLSPPLLTSTERATDANTSAASYHQRRRLVGNGSFGLVWQISKDRVAKVPKSYREDDPEDDPETSRAIAHSNWVNRAEIQNEKEVFERLGSYDGIIQCFKATNEMIELAFANQGDLSTYMQTKPPPPHEVRTKWIQLLVDTFSYVHARKIVVRDIALRNILVHDNSLKLSDFGETFLLSLETDMERFCINGTTPKIEILHVGFILYSIVVWQELKYDYFYTERWPEAAELPATDGILFGSIIQKCWGGEYASMEALQKDVHGIADE
jgi:hypothetical protein